MNDSQDDLENNAHQIALNLQFCHEYVFAAGKKVITRLTLYKSEKSMFIIGTPHTRDITTWISAIEMNL